MVEQDPAIIIKDLYKSFKLPHEQHSGIKQLIINLFKGVKGYEIQEVLDDISFEIKKGEFFGIVGRNGSGKSTLLKLIANIYVPDKGLIHVDGSLTPFIELGVGFNLELTGRENVYLNGALLGFSKLEMDEMYDNIVEFAELAKFMDQKLKNYSSGMQVRLAFSIAIRARSDILVIDEVLAVGDEAFQKKCFDYFEELKKDKKTIVLVTHDMSAVKRFCSRAILIENGKIKSEGSPNKVANQYSLDNLNHEASDQSGKNMSLNPEVKSLNAKALSSLSPEHNDTFEFEIDYELNADIAIDLGISIIYQGQSIIEHNTKLLEMGHKKDTKYSIKYKLPLGNFNPKGLQVDVAIFEKKEFSLIGFKTNAINFQIIGKGKPKGGLLCTKGEWMQ
jgi:ABC-2 type transport system ATP-binding protein